MLTRRSILTAVVSGGFWFRGAQQPRSAGIERVRSLSDYKALAEMCAGLCCSNAIYKASVRALPAAEMSLERLAELILVDLQAVSSTRNLKQAARQCSRQDFQYGKVAIVNGWILSLTETRLYALAGLLNLHARGSVNFPGGWRGYCPPDCQAPTS